MNPSLPIAYTTLLIAGLLNARKHRDILKQERALKLYMAAFGVEMIVLAVCIVQGNGVGIGISVLCPVMAGVTIYLTGKGIDRMEGVGR